MLILQIHSLAVNNQFYSSTLLLPTVQCTSYHAYTSFLIGFQKQLKIPTMITTDVSRGVFRGDQNEKTFFHTPYI